MKNILTIFIAAGLLSSCMQAPTANEILASAIQAHGGDKIYNSNISFDFRDKHYEGKYKEGTYELSRNFSDSLGNKIVDVLTNDGFKRSINDTLVTITDEWARKYSNSVNSVFYFTKLPFNLKDDAVNLTYLGEGNIENKPYYTVKVTFGKEGGGEDFDDVFVYWFNKETYTLDYFAYEYATSGGGKRFRKAINQRTINGWLMSDYINYKPKDLTVDIANYDTYFAKDGFKKLSEIVNRNVKVSY